VAAKERAPLSSFVALSLAGHVAGLGALAAAPRLWPWCVAALAADHVALNAAGLLPRGRLLGPNLVRLPREEAARGRVALTFDDGPDPEVTPRVLDLLDARGAKGTFFVIGERAARRPDLVREIAARGHALGNHTWSHPVGFYFLAPRRIAREIDDVQRLVAELCGAAPRHFRAPAGIRSALLEPLLARRGMTLATWTRRGFDAACGDPRTVARRLLRGLAAGDLLLLHDGAPRRAPDGTPVSLAVLPRLLDEIERRGLSAAPLA